MIIVDNAKLRSLVLIVREGVGAEAEDFPCGWRAAMVGLDVLAALLDEPAAATAARVADAAPLRLNPSQAPLQQQEEPEPPEPPIAAAADAPKYSPEREALMHELWPQAEALTTAALVARINALPGPPIAAGSIHAYAQRIGLPTSRLAAADALSAAAPVTPPEPCAAPPAFMLDLPPAAPARAAAVEAEPQPELADAAVARRQQRARDMLANGAEAASVVASTKLPLREVLRLGFEVRENRRNGSAAHG